MLLMIKRISKVTDTNEFSVYVRRKTSVFIRSNRPAPLWWKLIHSKRF